MIRINLLVIYIVLGSFFVLTLAWSLFELYDILGIIRSHQKTLTPEEWRRNHPKCKHCMYGKFVDPGIISFAPAYWECVAKDKVVNEQKTRIFCKLFDLKGETNDKI